MHSQQLSELMQAAANDAKAYFIEQHQLTLDDSIDSIKFVDDVLTKLNQQEQIQRHSAELLFTLSNILAAYIGEVFIANVGGSWQQNKQDDTAPFVYIKLNDKEFPFASVCYHKITRDNNISLHDYVQQAMANAMQ